MTPGNPGYAELVQLGLANEAAADKETIFVSNLLRLGYSLQTAMVRVDLNLPEGAAKQYILPIQELATEILEFFPQKLLFGHDLSRACRKQVEETLVTFWEAYRYVDPGHPVYQDHASELGKVIPCRLHMDEGTSFRKHAVMQMSWGPILKHLPASPHHCFYFTSILGDAYKDENVGYEAGNSILDAIAEHIAIHCRRSYYFGVQIPGEHERLYLAWVGLEGDLPAQARMMHFNRHFSCAPNRCCPWCLADDRQMPYADFRPNALWTETTGVQRPWSKPAPLLKIPGAATETFACKDVFHLCHLGILRTGVASLLCYLCFAGHFCGAGRASMPARLHHAYSLFRTYCRRVLNKTPHLKDFTRDNLQWGSLNEMPESTMFLA